jgi:hypothetical protein
LRPRVPLDNFTLSLARLSHDKAADSQPVRNLYKNYGHATRIVGAFHARYKKGDVVKILRSWSYRSVVGIVAATCSIVLVSSPGIASANQNRPPLAGATMYVQKDGSAAPCGDIAHACGNIQDAVDGTGPGGTVEVAPGIYCENLSIDRSITITAMDSGDPSVIEGSAGPDCSASGSSGQSVLTVGDSTEPVLHVFLNAVNVEGGDAGGDPSHAGMGGGVFVYPGATLTAANVVISGNAACGSDNDGCPSDVFGGGVYSLGNTQLSNSAVIDNAACGDATCNGYGGGIYQGTSGSLTLSNVTIAENSACMRFFCVGAGGGIAAGASNVLLVNDTVSTNSACADVVKNWPTTHPCRGAGAGISVSDGAEVDMSNTIVDDNSWTSVDCQGAVADASPDGSTTVGNNLVGESCELSGSTDQVADNAGTDDLADNGGTVATMALDPNSPAIGAGDAATCLLESLPDGAPGPSNTDARGITRSADSRGVCDIGAYDSSGFGSAPESDGPMVVQHVFER